MYKPRIAIVGAGIFGISTALKLVEHNYEVDIFEKKQDILTAASGINQYRLHKGYHYPRGPNTTKNCKDLVTDFYNEYSDSIIYDTEQHYCISKRDSFVSGSEFIAFCERMNLEYTPVHLETVRKEAIDICIRVDENLFDIRKLYSIAWNKLKSFRININFGIEPDDKVLAPYDFVVAATYMNNNMFLKNHAEAQIEYQYELCEKIVVRLPKEFQNKGIVIMDGPFMCLDPFGCTGFHVMGHVVNAIYQTNIGKESEPLMDERFERLLNNGIIKNPPISNFSQIISSATEFFHGIEKAEHIGSMFTYRVVLPNMDDTDERPTIVKRIDDRIITIFSGKIPTCVDAANQVLDMIRKEN